MAAERLVRVRDGAMLGGVCTGIARRYALDVTILRILFVLLALASGAGIVLYLAAWIIMPTADSLDRRPSEVARANVDDVVETAKRTASGIAHTNPEEVAGQARRAAREVSRAVTDAAESARSALQRDGRERGAPTSSGGTHEDAGAERASASPSSAAASAGAQRGGGFRPPSTNLPSSGPNVPPGAE